MASFAASLETVKVDTLESWLDSLSSDGDQEAQEKGAAVAQASEGLEGAVNGDVNAMLHIYNGDVCMLSSKSAKEGEVPETLATVLAVDSRLSPRDGVSKHVVRSGELDRSSVSEE